MSNHTPPFSPPEQQRSKQKRPQRSLPRGRAKLVALDVARSVVRGVRQLDCRGEAHYRDHLKRAAGNTVLALSEASGQVGGNRWVHLVRAYGECQEVQEDLEQLQDCGIDVPAELTQQADRLGGLIFGLLRSSLRNDR